MKTLYTLGAALLLILSIQTAHADSYPDGCTATTKYSSTTGHLCTAPLHDCAAGDLFSAQTGKPCAASTYLPGCYSTNGFSVTTGKKCDGSVPVTQQDSAAQVPTVTNNQATVPPVITQSTEPAAQQNSQTVMPAQPDLSGYTVSIRTLNGQDYVVDATDPTRTIVNELAIVPVPHLDVAQRIANEYIAKNGVTAPLVMK